MDGALALVLHACAEKTPLAQLPAPSAAAQSVPVVYAASRLLGQWNGPEGTYLLVAGANGMYALTIRNLDGARSFEGSAAGDTIVFERDGKGQTIRPSDGAGTGMKWLSDKKECVVIEPGEGFCRD